MNGYRKVEKEGKMKKELIELLKKYKFKVFIETIALIVLTYLITCPSKYLGKIIDLLYDIDANKQTILQNITIMILSTVGIIIVRLIFKKIDFWINLDMIKTLQDHLFKKLMKMRLEDIKAIKNGEIMSYFVRDAKKVPKYIFKFYLVLKKLNLLHIKGFTVFIFFILDFFI